MINYSKFGEDNETQRMAWVKNILSSIPRGKSLLDAGAGHQRYKKYCNHLNYVSQDFSGFNTNIAKEGLHTFYDYSGIDVVSDIQQLPFKNQSFDVVLCTEVLEHIPSPHTALLEFSRILKPGGLLIITAPFVSFTHYAPHHYSTGFSKYYYEHHLPSMKFEISAMESNGNYFSFLAQELLNLPSRSYAFTRTDINLLTKLEKLIFKWICQMLISILIPLLAWFSNLNSESEKLVCFGYHVIARKKL